MNMPLLLPRPGSRTLLLDVWLDQQPASGSAAVLPCTPDLGGWSAYLAGLLDQPAPGTVFAATVIDWEQDRLATEREEGWDIVQPPGPDVVACIRQTLAGAISGTVVPEEAETMAEALARELEAGPLQGVAYVAVGSRRQFETLWDGASLSVAPPSPL